MVGVMTTRQLTILDDTVPTPPPAAPRLVGRFHALRIVRNRPESLPGWRVTTTDRAVANIVAELLGGHPEEAHASGDSHIEVLTPATAVQVIIDGPDALSTGLELWGEQGLAHHCDGAEFLSPDSDRGRPCGCPPHLAERKALSMRGQGPAPRTVIYFRLAETHQLGEFRFESTSWKLHADTSRIITTLGKVGNPTTCELSIRTVEFTTTSGLRIPYRNPAVKVLFPF